MKAPQSLNETTPPADLGVTSTKAKGVMDSIPLQEGNSMSTIASPTDNVDFVASVAEIPSDDGPVGIEAQRCTAEDGTVSRLVVVEGRGVDLKDVPDLVSAILAAVDIASELKEVAA